MKKIKMLGIILTIVVSIVALSALYLWNAVTNTSFCVPYARTVGTYEDFVKSGENIPAEKMVAGVNINGLEGALSTHLVQGYLTNINSYINIKKQGFDHVRLPVNFNFYYDAEKKVLIDEKMTLIDNILDLAEKAGLYVQLDFHGWWEFNPQKNADKQTFLDIWELVAERYKDRSDLLCFDLVNEPKYYIDALNLLQRQAIERIRKTNPTRLILCAVADGNQPWLLNKLVLPKDDNIAVAVHIYNPGDFTHQGFEWANPPRKKGEQIRLTDEMMDELEWNLNETKKFMEETGHKVYLNEFGLNLNLAHPEDRSKFLRRMTEWCKENDVAWTFWGYNNGEMGLFINRKWNTAVLDDLFLR